MPYKTKPQLATDICALCNNIHSSLDLDILTRQQLLDLQQELFRVSASIPRQRVYYVDLSKDSGGNGLSMTSALGVKAFKRKMTKSHICAGATFLAKGVR